MPTNNIARRPRSELTLDNRHRRQRVDLRGLRRVLRAALEDPVFRAAPELGRRRTSEQTAPPLEYHLACHLVDEREIAALNAAHLGHPGPTDVISFDYGAPSGAVEAAGLCGEVFVCLDVARTQAREYRTTWSLEVVRYLVHGLLHIRGYDDLSASARRVMKREEDRMVAGLSLDFPLDQLAGRPRGRVSPCC